MKSSLRLHRALRCLGGDIMDGFGVLGRGMSSALVGSGYGWDGWCVCLGGGKFSSWVWFGGCGGECLCGVRGVIVESGVVGWVCGGVGDLGRGQKKLYYLRLLLKLRISGGSEFCFKIYIEREICVKKGGRWISRS